MNDCQYEKASFEKRYHQALGLSGNLVKDDGWLGIRPMHGRATVQIRASARERLFVRARELHAALRQDPKKKNQRNPGFWRMDPGALHW